MADEYSFPDETLNLPRYIPMLVVGEPGTGYKSTVLQLRSDGTYTPMGRQEWKDLVDLANHAVNTAKLMKGITYRHGQ